MTSGTNSTSKRPYLQSTVTGREVTACTLFFDGQNPGTSSYAMTHSSNVCSYTFTTDIAETSFRYYIRASDGNDARDSAISEFKVDTNPNTIGGAVVAQQQAQVQQAEAQKSKNNKIMFVVVIIVVIVVIYFIRKK